MSGRSSPKICQHMRLSIDAISSQLCFGEEICIRARRSYRPFLPTNHSSILITKAQLIEISILVLADIFIPRSLNPPHQAFVHRLTMFPTSYKVGGFLALLASPLTLPACAQNCSSKAPIIQPELFSAMIKVGGSLPSIPIAGGARQGPSLYVDPSLSIGSTFVLQFIIS